MSSFGSLQGALLFANLLAMAALTARLFTIGLFRQYPFFTSYLVMSLAQWAVGKSVTPGTHLYAVIFMITEGLIVSLFAFVVLELYSIVLRDLQGLATTSRRFITG